MNTEKFTGKAQGYAQYRPSYPDAFIDYLYSEVGFVRQSVVADIGSGTGIFSALLLHRGSHVIGVEPNADMRAAAEDKLSAYPGFISVAAAAEQTGLADGAVDFVTAAQAFHWFDRGRFAAECRRILKPDGKVVLVWNSPARDEMTAACEEVCRELCPDFKGFSGGRDGEQEDYTDFFRAGAFEFRTFDNTVTLDRQAFIGRYLSTSYAPKEGQDIYEAYVRRMGQVFERYAPVGAVPMRYVTRSYVGMV